MIEGREIKEITVDKDELMVTIPLAEYRKLIKKAAKLKVEKELISKAKEESDKVSIEDYRRWWREEEKQRKDVEAELESAKALITELKVDIDLIKNKESGNE